jgi:hypothetical protein
VQNSERLTVNLKKKLIYSKRLKNKMNRLRSYNIWVKQAGKVNQQQLETGPDRK